MYDHRTSRFDDRTPGNNHRLPQFHCRCYYRWCLVVCAFACLVLNAQGEAFTWQNALANDSRSYIYQAWRATFTDNVTRTIYYRVNGGALMTVQTNSIATGGNVSTGQWTGLSAQNSEVDVTFTNHTIMISWGLDSGTSLGQFGLPVGTNTAKVTYKVGVSGVQSGSLTVLNMRLHPGTGEATVLNPPVVNPPWESPWKDREGDNVKVPIYREEDGPFKMKIGDKEYEFDAKEGVAWVDFKIPANWDGTATIDGVPVRLAGNMGYTGTPSMGASAGTGTGSWLANPYGPLPPGVTPNTRPNTLPPGVTAGNNLPLPPGVSVGTVAIQNGNVVTVTGTPSGSSTSVTSTTGSSGGTPGTVVNNSGGNVTDNSTTIIKDRKSVV